MKKFLLIPFALILLAATYGPPFSVSDLSSLTNRPNPSAINPAAIVVNGTNSLDASGGLFVYLPTATNAVDNDTYFASTATGRWVRVDRQLKTIVNPLLMSGGRLSLANSSVVPGTYTNTILTVNSNGLVTFASNGPINLPTSGVSAGTYTNVTLTVNSNGIVTFATNGIITSGGSSSNWYAYIYNISTLVTNFALIGNDTLSTYGPLTWHVTGGTNIYADIATHTISDAMLDYVPTNTLKGSDMATAAGAIASVGDIQIGANLQLSGGVLSAITSSGTNTWQIGVDGTVVNEPNLADGTYVTVSASGSNVTFSIPASGATAGTYTNATVTVNDRGFVTSISSGSGGGSGGGDVYSSSNNVFTGTNRFLGPVTLDSLTVTNLYADSLYFPFADGLVGVNTSSNAIKVTIGSGLSYSSGTLSATGGGGGGNVYTSSNNVFTGTNTFTGPITLDSLTVTNLYADSLYFPFADGIVGVNSSSNAFKITIGANLTYSGGTLSATASTNGGTAVTVDGGADLTRANFADTTGVNVANSGTNVTINIVDRDFGDLTTSSSGTVMTIDNNAITSNKVAAANITQDKLSAAGTPTSTNFLAGDYTYKQVTTNMIPGLVGDIANLQRSLTFTNGVTNVNNVVSADLAAGSNISFSTNNGKITIASTASGSGLSVNGSSVSTPNFTNSSTALWNVSGTNISLTITNVPGTTTSNVLQWVGSAYFVVTNNSTIGDFKTLVTNGIITAASCVDCQNDSPGIIEFSFPSRSTNYVWTFMPEGNVNGYVAYEAEGYRAATSLRIKIHEAAGSVFFTGGYWMRFDFWDKVAVGGSGSGSGGETNTASNLGTPSSTVQGLYASKSGVDLRFRSIEAGSGITLSSNANTVSIASTAAFNPSTTIDVFEEFAGVFAANDLYVQSASSGGGQVTVTDKIGGAVYNGFNSLLIRAGTSATGYGVASSQAASIEDGLGRYTNVTVSCRVGFANLSTTAEAYAFQFGLGDVYTTTNQVDGAVFEHNANTTNWVLRCWNNSTTATNETTVAVTASPQVISLTWNGANTNIVFSINSSPVWTNTSVSSIPVSRSTGIMAGAIRSAGTTQREIYLDWARFTATPTVAR